MNRTAVETADDSDENDETADTADANDHPYPECPVDTGIPSDPEYSVKRTVGFAVCRAMAEILDRSMPGPGGVVREGDYIRLAHWMKENGEAPDGALLIYSDKLETAGENGHIDRIVDQPEV